jgi:hypothetical protein
MIKHPVPALQMDPLLPYWPKLLVRDKGPTELQPFTSCPYSPNVLERLYEKWSSEGISLL